MTASFTALSAIDKEHAKTAARNFAHDVLVTTEGTVDFESLVDEAGTIGYVAINRSNYFVNRMLSKANNRLGSSELASHLGVLRQAGFNAEMGVPVLGFIPAVSKIGKAVRKLSVVVSIKKVQGAKDAILSESGFINSNEEDILSIIHELNCYHQLAVEVSTIMSAEVERLSAEGNVKRASALQFGILEAANNRQQELAVQIALMIQNKSAMDAVVTNNSELIDSFNRINNLLAA